jgi:hypothetical protein
MYLNAVVRIHHFDANPDPAFRFDADPDPNFRFDVDPDPILPLHFSRFGPSNAPK